MKRTLAVKLRCTTELPTTGKERTNPCRNARSPCQHPSPLFSNDGTLAWPTLHTPPGKRRRKSVRALPIIDVHAKRIISVAAPALDVVGAATVYVLTVRVDVAAPA
jgi:hypothetical protein